MRHSGLFANIQLLRFIAAAMVVGFHAVPANYGIQGEVTTYAKWAWHGGFGVDIFFVISGFVISATTLDKSRNLISSLDFTRKRFMRIYLGYWPFFLWAIVQTWLLAEDRLPNIDFLGSFFLTETNHLKLILSVSWSLTYELYFYCIFACLFLFSRIKTVIFVHILFVLILLRAIYVPLD